MTTMVTINYLGGENAELDDALEALMDDLGFDRDCHLDYYDDEGNPQNIYAEFTPRDDRWQAALGLEGE